MTEPTGLDAVIERASAAVHDRWVATKREQGITSRRSETGEELVVPYADLSEAAKELDRGSVRATVEALADTGLLADLQELAEAGWLRAPEVARTQPTVHRVAVTVFALVEGADARDASHVAEIALRQNLSGCAAGPPEPLPVTIHARLARGSAPVTVVQVMETGMAAGNGYLWTAPTPKAFREGE